MNSYTLVGGVSRARSAARAFRKWFSTTGICGCAPPSTRRAVGSISSSIVTASRRSSSVAPGSYASNYLGLVARYVSLVVANAWRTRGPLRIISLLCVVGAAWTASAAARTEHGDDCPLAK